MKIDHLTAALVLVRASKLALGSAECATLFSLGQGANSAQVSRALNVDIGRAKSRLRLIKVKGFIKIKTLRDGSVFYELTPKGQDAIRYVTKGTAAEQTKPSTHEQP